MRSASGIYEHVNADSDASPAATPLTPTKKATLNNVMHAASVLDDGMTPTTELFVKAGRECGVGKKEVG